LQKLKENYIVLFFYKQLGHNTSTGTSKYMLGKGKKVWSLYMHQIALVLAFLLFYLLLYYKKPDDASLSMGINYILV